MVERVVSLSGKRCRAKAAEPEVVVSRPSLQSPCSTVNLSISSSPSIIAPTFYSPTMVPSSQRSLREALRVIVRNAREALRVSSRDCNAQSSWWHGPACPAATYVYERTYSAIVPSNGPVQRSSPGSRVQVLHLPVVNVCALLTRLCYMFRQTCMDPPNHKDLSPHNPNKLHNYL